MDDTVDLLKIKIEKANRELPLETVNAINSVDWRATILGLRTKRGYTFEQLGDLELETELLLCGLADSKNYSKELEQRMHIPKAQVNELVNEMNDMVFKKIREELIRNTERKKIFERGTENSPLEESPLGEGGQSTPSRERATPQEGNKKETAILDKAGIEIMPEKLELTTPAKPAESREDILKKIEKPELIKEPKPTEKANPILAQKLLTSIKIPTAHTDHSLPNLQSSSPNGKSLGSKVDPYRELPE